MKPEAHGGDLLRMAATAGRDPASLLDFSVNVRPEGPPEFIRAALFRAMTALAAYPSPHAEEAMLAAARHHGMDASRFVFGSGSNELIHALARVLRKRGVSSVRVVEPAFSEYAIACRLAGIKAIPVWGGIIEKNQCVPTTDTGKDEAVPTRDLLDALTDAPEGSAVFLANPGNPSGLFRTPEECLRLMSSRSNLLWIIDEAFVEYAGTETEASVLQRLPKNGIVLRSLTKFHAVPGVRLGYLAADAELAQAIRDELPAWSVNAFALAAAQAVFADTSDFAAQTRAENAERRADLAAALSSLPGIEVYPSAANYVLFRWPGAPRNLLGILLKRLRHRRPRLLQLPRAQRRLMVPCRRPLSRRPPPPCRSPLRNPGNDAWGFLLPAPRNPGFTRIRQQGFNKHKSLRKRRDGGLGEGREKALLQKGFSSLPPAFPAALPAIPRPSCCRAPPPTRARASLRRPTAASSGRTATASPPSKRRTCR